MDSDHTGGGRFCYRARVCERSVYVSIKFENLHCGASGGTDTPFLKSFIRSVHAKFVFDGCFRAYYWVPRDVRANDR